MSEFDAFFKEVAQEETEKRRQTSEVTSLGAATTFEPPSGALPALPKIDRPDEFAGFFEEVKQEESAKVSRGLQLAEQHDPETYGKARAIADRDGLMVDFAVANLGALEKRETVSKMRKALEANPGLREWFSSEDNGAVVKLDELERLSGLSWLFQSGGAAFSEGYRQTRLAEIGHAQLYGRATPEMIAEADRIEAQARDEFGADGWFSGAWTSAAQMAPMMIESGIAGFKGAAVGGGTGALIGGVGGAAAGGVGAVPGAAAGLAVGAKAGAAAGAALKAYELESGLAYREFLGFKDEQGNRLDPDAARLAAALSGFVNAGLETFSLGTMLQTVPALKALGLDEATRLFGREGLKEALKRPTFRAAMTAAAKQVGEAGATEITTEMAQEAMTILGGELAKSASDGEFDFLTPGQWAARIGEAGIETAKAMTIMGPLFAAPGFVKDLGAARRSQKTVAIFTQLNEDLKDDGLRERNPQKFKEAFEAATSDAAKTVYVPVERLNELFQSYNVNPADLQFDDFPGAYAEAMATGGDVEMRLSDYATKLAGTDLGNALIPHLRLSPEDMTQAEAEAFNEAWQETRARLMEEDLEALKAESAREAPGQQVFLDIRDKAVAAGRSLDVAEQYATVWQAFFSTLADKTGGDAFQLYQDRGVEIRFAFPEQLSYQSTDDLDLLLDDLRAGREVAVDREKRKALGPSLSTFLRSKGGLQDSGGELRARDVGGTLLAKSGKGMNLDDAALAAWEAGYFPEFGETRPSIDDLLAALDRELGGDSIYTGGRTPDSVDLSTEYLARLDTMGRTLDELGLSVQSLSNETIRQELEAITNRDAEQGALFQFAGVQGAVRLDGAEVPALQEAARMQAQGAYPDEIFEATGWFQGVDGAWRFEIADADATVNVSAFTENRFVGRLGDVLTHDKLFKAYPALADSEVALSLGEKDDGAFYEDTGEIEASAGTPEKLRSILLHEIAHAIQATEGFAPGGNTTMGEIYEGEAVERLQSEVQRLQQRSMLADPTDLMTAKQKLAQAARFEYYRRIAGEVEARNVEAREAERQAGQEPDLPWYTQDVPDGQQIVIVRTDTHGEAMQSVGAPREYFQGKSDLGGPRADKRGSIQFGTGRTIINLFEKADLSTFLHESGHFFLEVTRDMALAENAPQALKDDWQQIKDWLGLTDDKITVDAHEQFARGFEAYLFEGKAPSEALQGAFSRFRAWLTFIYRKITRLNVTVTPEIKAVFDRMLATEEEINAQQNAREFRGWMDQATTGMEDAEFQRYRQLAEAATEQAKADLQARLLADVKRETSREWRENKKAVREEVVDEFSRMPVYQVTHYLRTGQSIAEGVVVPGARMVLDRAYLVDRYGDSVLTRLPRYVPPIYADPATNKRKDVAAVHPDILAEAFGYESGDALVQDLLSAPPMARAITEEVALRMRDRYGDLLNDQARLADEAVAAMHNDKRAEFIETEMRALSRRGGVNNPMPRQVAARMARDIIAAKKIADAQRVGFYTRQEQKAASEAEKAILAGDFKAAAEWKRKQLFAHYLALESRRAKEEVERATRYLNRFGNRKRPASVDPDYLDQIEGLLERYDLRPSTSLRTIERRKALAAFIAEKEAAGEMIAIPQHLRDEAATVSYKDLTVDDLRAVVDSVQNLEHLGKLKNKLILNRKAIDFQNAKDELTAALEANTDRRKDIKGFTPTKWEKLQAQVLSAAATMARIEQVIEWLDGGDINGPWRRMLWKPVADAEAREIALREQVMAPILAVWDTFPKGYLAESHHFPGMGRSLKKSEIFAIALNTGTASNLDRLMKGERLRKGGGVDTQAKLDEALGVLTKQDWDAIQKIWDQINSLWPEASALEKRLTGLEPVKVEAREVVTPHGTYQGGYYPLVYDNAQSVDVSARLMSKEDLQMDPQFARLGREAGYLKSRVEEYSEPLSVNLDVIQRHIEKVVHDITHWEAVKEVNKILMDPQIATAIRDHLGAPFQDEFKKWLKRIWHGDDLGDVNGFQRFLGKVRSNAGIYALAYRWTTVITQFAGFGPSVARVGLRPLASAMKQYWMAGPSNPMEGGQRNAVEEFVFSKSSEMRNRASTLSREVRLGLAKVQGEGGALAAAQRFGFMGIAVADRWVSVPTWLAGYNAHLEQFPADEQGAIEAGDRAVRLSQGTGGTKDVSSLQVDPNFQLLTMFYGPFNVLFNNLWTLNRDFRTAFQTRDMELARDVFWRGLWFVVVPAVMADLLTGRGPDDEDKEEKGLPAAYASWAVWKVALYPLATIPLLRDAASAFDRGFESDPNPVGRMLGAGFKVATEIGKGSEANPRVIAKNTADAAGMAVGLPIGQATTIGNNAWRHAQEGDLQWTDFLFSRR
ncbi:LPD23 domain-containing protein [Microvirga mediterraneensis]|uniref:Large polyvalent protein associated domain-containing protein n=1 Tax=Microvirga mediterraneensis TaxID=2754695 RepID=A0A838BW85_9HYPH|nr:LPD23 domain-containing protein [Microvirga mediterraneensis]MBA1159339.1 hypothetical protein [Microvirga mediterraneensis]